MKLIKAKNYNEMSEKAAEIVIKEIKRKPALAIAFATGKTPLGLYEELVKAYKKRKIDFSKIKAFNLDEYYPIKKSERRSFYYYLHKNLFDKVNIKKENINLLNGETKNPNRECKDYENKIKKNKIDLMILGVGVNGHIAFNEPGSLNASKTRLVKLKHKAVKNKALTIGISTMLLSKKLVLLASGKKKAGAVKCLIKCKPNSCCPASFLRKHKDLVVIADKDAEK
ncbi:MAG: glucosamine-6-phosphate deaminase [Nanoarchaeota archaeon]|nr:glucosamine-6-phosphate deaminase [Nanoarchaeota archaeon]